MGTSGLWLFAQNPGDSLDLGLAWGRVVLGDSGRCQVDGVGVQVDCKGPSALGGRLRGGEKAPT